MVTVILKVVEDVCEYTLYNYAEEYEFDSLAEANYYVEDCIGNRKVRKHNIRPNGIEYWELDYDDAPCVGDILEIRLLW